MRNTFQQDVRDAWLAGLTINEIVENNVRVLSFQQYVTLCAQWHKCESEAKHQERLASPR